MKKLTMICIAALLMVATSIPIAQAAFEWPVQEWTIPFMGTMKTPDGFSAVEINDFKGFVETEKKKMSDPPKKGMDAVKQEKENKALSPIPAGTPVILTEALPADSDAATKRFLKSDFSLYHLTIDDGDVIHTAWFLAARDGEELPANIDVFTAELTPEQSLKLDELKKWVDENIHKAQYTDAKTKVSLKLLQVMPLQALSRDPGGKLWTTGGRAMIAVENLPFAFFTHIYAMSINNKLTVGVLAGFDGERQFWEPVIRNMLLGVKETPTLQ